MDNKSHQRTRRPAARPRGGSHCRRCRCSRLRRQSHDSARPAAVIAAAVLVVALLPSALNMASATTAAMTTTPPTAAATTTTTGTPCAEGFELVNGACEDIDECKLSYSGAISPPVCDPRTVCSNTPGSYVCGPCPVNFEGTGKEGCRRLPSLDAVDGNLILRLDDTRDVQIKAEHALGDRSGSLRSAISTAMANKQDVSSTSSELGAAISSLATDVERNTEDAEDRHATLSSTVGTVSNAVAVIEEDFEDAVLHLANVSDLAGVGHSLARTLQEEIIGLTRQLNDTNTGVNRAFSLASAADTRAREKEVELESTDASLMQELSHTKQQISAMQQCALMGQVFDGNSCAPACASLSPCEGVTCSADTKGAFRYRDGVAEVCDGQAFTRVSVTTTGISPSDPAESCQELKELGYITDVYYVTEGTEVRVRLCDLSGDTGFNAGGDGSSTEEATRDCSLLDKYFGRATGLQWIEDDEGNVRQLYCDTKTGQVEPDGSSKALAARTCGRIRQSYEDRADGTKWITAGLQDAFKVTCDGGDIVIGLDRLSPYADNAYMISSSSSNLWSKCSCSSSWKKQMTNRANGWDVGVVPQNTHTETCQDYFDFTYRTADHTLTADQVKALAPLAADASNRNFEIFTMSCDDDGEPYPDGHWIGIQKAPGSNTYVHNDCTSGNVGCCDRTLKNNFDTYPFPLRGCGSINTGGGAILLVTTNTLRIHT